MQYSNVITKLGDVYDPTNSTFTSPLEGYYFFAWSTSRYNIGYTLISIVVNGDMILNESAYAGKNSLHVGDSTSHTVVLYLQEGDRVLVKLLRNAPPYLEKNGFVDIDAFTGYRVY